MSKRHQTKLVHEGEYAAEVDVELIESSEGWGPYLSLDDVRKLDEVQVLRCVAVTSKRRARLRTRVSADTRRISQTLWDEQIEQDLETGRLDGLLERVDIEYEACSSKRS